MILVCGALVVATSCGKKKGETKYTCSCSMPSVTQQSGLTTTQKVDFEDRCKAATSYSPLIKEVGGTATCSED